MASAPPPSFHATKRTTNYARLCRLLVDVSSHILRVTFEKKRPPGKLDTVLSSPRVHAELQKLRARKVLNPLQWGKLYPTIKSSVSSQNFDITLLMVLLRNICGLGPPPTGWDTLPPAEDTTFEADIVRIKYYRNKIYGHAAKASVDDTTFNQYWKAIQESLVRLGGAGYREIIDDLKKECMDPDLEEHYKELLKQWVMDEVSIKERLDEMRESFERRFEDLEMKMVQPERSKKKGVKNYFTGWRSKEDVNILILGETGVGKSTWINGIANYFKHSSLQAAIDAHDFTVLIPFRFAYTSEEGEGIEVSFGSDANEIFATGQSATQSPREYMFETDIAKFHLIDTPGIGDCRGTDKDKENFENTLAFLTIYDKIHAVVVLLKPNNARLTVAFRFCVLELLTHLHKSLESNIIFAFTNSRGTFYQPGDTLPILKKLLTKHNLKINVSPSNYFCFDNEAFRFLACKRKGIEFTSKKVGIYAESWDTSCETTNKLFQRIMEMKPHDTKKTLSLNEARSYIIALSKPMGEAVELIGINLKKINDEKEKCKAYESDINSFRAQLSFKGFDLNLVSLEYPITVCAGRECKTYVSVGEDRVMRTVYNQICHDHCYLSGVPVEIINNERLYGCAAMQNGFCSKCSHSYNVHMHITYKTTLVEKEFLSKETQRAILEKRGLKAQKEAFILFLMRRINELEEEKDYIYESASFFGIFLKNNAMLPYNDSFSEYIGMLIKDEEVKEKDIRDDEKIRKFKKERQTYEEKKNLLIKTMASSSQRKFENSHIKEIYARKEKLCSLTHNGRMLKDALDGVMSATKNMYQGKSTRCLQVYGSDNFWTRFLNKGDHFR